jgi:hypothetical protein
MHQPVKDSLEEYLRGMGGKFESAVPQDMAAHLGSCRECADELSELERQSVALRSLRAPDALELRAGFYARVMQRIDDARTSNSVWSAFLDPIFAKRLVLASGTLVVLLGTYLISTEPGYPTSSPAPAAVAVSSPDATATSDEPENVTSPQERDAVLVSLASYQ